VDPQGVLGIHQYWTILICNLGLFLFGYYFMVTMWTAACIIVLNESTGANMEFPKRLERNFIRNCCLWSLAYFVVEDVCTLNAYYHNSGFLLGIRFFARSAIMWGTAICIVLVIRQAARVTYKTQFPSGRPEGTSAGNFFREFLVSRVAIRMSASAVLFMSFATLYLGFGCYYVINGGLMRDEEVNDDPEHYKFPVWVYAFNAGEYAIAYLAWIPIKFSYTAEPKVASTGQKVSNKNSQDKDSAHGKSGIRKPSASEMSVDPLKPVDIHAKFSGPSPKSAEV